METDQYYWPGSNCPRNKLGIRDPDEFTVAQAQIVSIREVQLATDLLPGEYNLEHLQQFHRHLFQDIYDWAGETRCVDISKGRSRFAHWRYLSDNVAAVLTGLERDDWLTGRTRVAFVDRLSYYYGELNVCHPFREGNGRTIRAFLRQLAAAAGWSLDWSELSRGDNIAASEHSVLTGLHDRLIAVLAPVVSHI